MPFTAAPIACSRTPKAMFRPSYPHGPPTAPWTPSAGLSGFWKSPAPLSQVKVDGLRSAEPPASSGRRAVALEGVLLLWRAVAGVRADDQQRGARALGASPLDRLRDGVDVVAVRHALDVPAVGGEAPRHVLGEADRRAAGEGDAVVVVEDHELAEPEVPRQRARLGPHAFHEIAVACEHVGVVVDERVAGAVEASGQVSLGDGHPDGVAEPLTERTRGRLDAGGEVALGMPRGAAPEPPEALDLLERQVVSRQVQERVEQHRAVPGGEDEAIAVRPPGVGRVVGQEAGPEDVRHRRRPHRQAGMPGVGPLDRVSRQKPDGIDRQRIEGGRRHRGGGEQGRRVELSGPPAKRRSARRLREARGPPRRLARMSYVDRHLAGQERVVFRTRLHPTIFGNAVGFAAFVIFAATMITLHNELAPATVRLVCLGAAALAALGFVSPLVTWRTSEFAVTDRRVMIKVGLLSVHTVELLNPKVEAIGVDQTLAGRLLGYGTLRITGTGGTVEAFPRVARPDALRDAVMGQVGVSPVARAR